MVGEEAGNGGGSPASVLWMISGWDACAVPTHLSGRGSEDHRQRNDGAKYSGSPVVIPSFIAHHPAAARRSGIKDSCMAVVAKTKIFVLVTAPIDGKTRHGGFHTFAESGYLAGEIDAFHHQSNANPGDARHQRMDDVARDADVYTFQLAVG